jgi:quaternary ammonium compound-resistance protein SugE
MTMGWLFLAFGTVGEVAWVMTLKSTEGFSKLWPSILNISIAFFNIVVLSKAFNMLPTTLAYSIWVGLSAVVIAVLAWYLQGESFNAAKIGFMLLILIGVIGLKSLGDPDNNKSVRTAELIDR